MCKHVAAALYGVGARLDDRPELLFVLHDVDENELLAGVEQDLPLTREPPGAAKVLDDMDVAAPIRTGNDRNSSDRHSHASGPEAGTKVENKERKRAACRNEGTSDREKKLTSHGAHQARTQMGSSRAGAEETRTAAT
jgi:uncharacterized Zn finger protein